LENINQAVVIVELLNNIWTFQVDGVIALAAHFEHDSLELFAQHQIPVVLYNRNVPDSNANTVCCNHEKGIKQLIDLLNNSGHKSYLIIAGPEDSDVANERRTIAQKHLLALGYEDVPVIFGDYSYESARKEFAEWSKENLIPDAVICSNDIMAIGVIDEAKEKLNLDVPEDLSVVGFDGVSASQWFNYQLTTIQQPLEQLTKAAVDILIERIKNPDSPPESRVLSGTFIKGNSYKARN
jgi:DNA-binding LacI/PurR family transcriptional regulator